MKKTLILFLIILMLSTMFVELQAETQQTIKNLGLVLILVGGYLAYDGYSTIETRIDISNPSIDSNNWSWNKTQAGVGYPWYVSSIGKIKNTGNVALKNIKIYETYLDSNGQSLGYGYTFPDVYWLDPLPVGTEDSWDDFDGGWNTEPTNVTIRVEYNYDPIYRIKKERKNENMGKMGVEVASVGVALVGVYLLIDYQLDLQKIQEKTGIDIDFKVTQNQIYLLASTKIF